MLWLSIPPSEIWNEEKQEFIYSNKEHTLQLEHSLVSLSKWESKWCKAFFSKEPKTREETIDYVKCMTLTQNVKPEVYVCLSNENIAEINQYIEAPMTATYIHDDNPVGPNREKITAELIYYWMITFNIPFECQKWHLNRLMTLIRVCSIKNRPPKRRSKRQIMSRNAALNAQRRKRLNTRG